MLLSSKQIQNVSCFSTLYLQVNPDCNILVRMVKGFKSFQYQTH